MTVTIFNTEARPVAATIVRAADATPAVPTLIERIAALLNASRPAEVDLRTALAEIDGEQRRLEADAKRTEASALDPRRSASEAAGLRQMADDLRHEVVRLDGARPMILAALDRAADDDAERVKAYQHAEAEAERVAERIASEYPDLAARLLDLLGDVVQATAVVVRVNRDLPKGRQPIEGPEGRARGFNHCAGTAPARRPMSICSAVIPPFAATDAALWPRTGTFGGGVQDGTAGPAFAPYSTWPKASDAEAARAELKAQTKAPAVAAE